MNPYKYIPVAKEIFFLEREECDYVKRSYHVSLVIVNKSIIGIGTNNRKSHPYMMIYGRNRIMMHSEVAAFMSARFISDKPKTLINFRFNNNGDLRLSRPCKDCLPLCLDEFSTVYYTTNYNTIERLF